MWEDVVILIVIFTFVLSMVGMILGHARWRHRQKDKADGSSLRTSELREMMREAVAEANEPLFERIEALEAQLQPAPRLMPAREEPLLEEPGEANPAPVERRRVT